MDRKYAQNCGDRGDGVVVAGEVEQFDVIDWAAYAVVRPEEDAEKRDRRIHRNCWNAFASFGVGDDAHRRLFSRMQRE